MLIKLLLVVFCSMTSFLAAQDQADQEKIAQRQRALERSKFYAMRIFAKNKNEADLQQGIGSIALKKEWQNRFKPMPAPFLRWQSFLNKALRADIDSRHVPADLQKFLDSMFEEFYRVIDLSNGRKVVQETASSCYQPLFEGVPNILQQIPFMYLLPLDEGTQSGVFGLPAPYDSWLFFMSGEPFLNEVLDEVQVFNDYLPVLGTVNLKNISRPFAHEQLSRYIAEEGIEGVYVPQVYFYHLPGHSDDVNDFNYAACVNMAIPPSAYEEKKSIFAPKPTLRPLPRCTKNFDRYDSVLAAPFERFAIASAMKPLAWRDVQSGFVLSVEDVYSTALLMDYLQIPTLSGGINMLMPMTTVILAFPEEVEIPALLLFNLFLLADFYFSDELKVILQQVYSERQKAYCMMTSSSSVSDSDVMLSVFLEMGLHPHFEKQWYKFLLDESRIGEMIHEDGEVLPEILHAPFLALRRLLYEIPDVSEQVVFGALMAKREQLRTFKPVQGFGGLTVEAELVVSYFQFLEENEKRKRLLVADSKR